MAGISSYITSAVLKLLTSPTGVDYWANALGEAGGLTWPVTAVKAFAGQNAAPELNEKSGPSRYPAVYVYCDKVSNLLREKFREFSGKAHVSIEVRVSQDRLQDIERRLELYADAVCQVLDSNRGDWGQGTFYAGGYEATFGPVRQGGSHFLQTAKIGFEVEISK